MTDPHNPQCFVNHMGTWFMETRWFMEAFGSIKSGAWKPLAEVVRDGDSGRRLYETAGDGVAIIPMSGPMMKGDSKYGGVNTLHARKAIRAAAVDSKVSAILLHIDSPGGHVAGTQELADEVKAAKKSKPVYAHIDDLGASASYWVASQADRISANAMGEVGSIGTVAVVTDSSGLYEAAGVKVHVISTGAYKGAFADGAPVTAEHLAYLQELVADMNEHFLSAVASGRKMSRKKLDVIADGRVHIASKALELGLVDVVQSFEKTLAEAGKAGRSMASNRTKSASALIDLEANQ